MNSLRPFLCVIGYNGFVILILYLIWLLGFWEHLIYFFGVVSFSVFIVSAFLGGGISINIREFLLGYQLNDPWKFLFSKKNKVKGALPWLNKRQRKAQVARTRHQKKVSK